MARPFRSCRDEKRNVWHVVSHRAVYSLAFNDHPSDKRLSREIGKVGMSRCHAMASNSVQRTGDLERGVRWGSWKLLVLPAIPVLANFPPTSRLSMIFVHPSTHVVIITHCHSETIGASYMTCESVRWRHGPFLTACAFYQGLYNGHHESFIVAIWLEVPVSHSGLTTH